ncbi:MAG: hypothetical protein JNK48_24015 [Bryobacterales bacterium]|nr:hypothetical protein [Bryobacterales bacterium]
MREALLEGCLFAGLAIVLWTETLSVLSLLQSAYAWPCWIAIALFAARSLHIAIRQTTISVHWWEYPLALALLSIASIVGATAVLSAPNSVDALAYHLPRIIYWLQQQSVQFFPTVYFNQLSMPPFAEYLMLHTFLLSGGDRLVNLVQCGGYLLAIAASSLSVRELGGSRSAQWLAAIFTATLPGAILQASGAKNDCVLAGLLLAALHFGLRGSHFWFAAAGALAVFTKSTAYLFLPPLLAAVIMLRGNAARTLAITLGLILAINGPHYARNIDLSGSPLGFDSAQGDGVFRWRNETIGPAAAFSNLLRHTSEQLGGRSDRWNKFVFDTVVGIHHRAGINPHDPATTWPHETYKPPRNANHEANIHNRWHLALYLASGIYLFATVRRDTASRPLAILFAAAVFALLGFCAYLKWQPFMQRLLVPLFALAAPPAAVTLSKLPRPFLLGIVLLLLNNTRPYLKENWIRPLSGPNSLLRTARPDQYFNDMTPWNRKPAYLDSAGFVRNSKCAEVGLDIFHLQIEYPLQILLRRHNPAIRFQHTGVDNASSKYARNEPAPCAVICLSCLGNAAKEAAYSSYPVRKEFMDFIVYTR